MPHALIPYIERVKNGELEISTLSKLSISVSQLVTVGHSLCITYSEWKKKYIYI